MNIAIVTTMIWVLIIWIFIMFHERRIKKVNDEILNIYNQLYTNIEVINKILDRLNGD